MHKLEKFQIDFINEAINSNALESLENLHLNQAEKALIFLMPQNY